MNGKSTTEENGIDDNLSDIEEAAAVKAESKEPSAPKPGATPKKKSSNKLLLLLLFISLLTAGYIFAPQPMKDDALALVKTWMKSKQSLQPQQKAENTPEAVVPKLPELAIVEPEPVAESAPEVISASSDEVNRMLAAMDQLQGELKSLHQQQQQLKVQQQTVQRMQLRARLRWVTNPVNHLAQIQLAWEEIALMPMLSADERQQAETMLALAEKNLQALQSWQQIMQLQADALTRREHANIIPAFENRWLNWIAEQFSVRPSLSQEEAEDAKLRDTLLNTSRNIEIEQWPDAKAWLQLRATLQLRMVAAATADSAEAKLDLPESFDAIRADMDQLRQTAATWMEQLQ